jgi:hypothetical protein
MKLWRSMMKLPQPLKGCLVAYLIAFAVVFVSVPASAILSQGKVNPVMPWGLGALGLTAVVVGVMLAADLRGSASAYASIMKNHKPMGVDYSKSFFANPVSIRIFGAMFALVGIAFIVGSTIMASPVS